MSFFGGGGGGGGSGSGLIGGALSSGLSFLAAKQQRDFIEKMYKNRYTYQMEDMRQAGLNPILSYSQAPPGGPQGGMAQIADMARSMQSGAQAGESSARTGKVSVESALIRQQTKTSAMLEKAHFASAEQSHSASQLNYQNALLRGKEQPKASLTADLFKTPVGKAIVYGSEGGSALGAAAGGFGRAFGTLRGRGVLRR